MPVTRAEERRALAIAELRGYLAEGRRETWYRAENEWERRCAAAGRPFIVVSRRGPAFSTLTVSNCDGVTEAFVADLWAGCRRRSFAAIDTVDGTHPRAARRGHLYTILRHEQAHAAAERLAGKGLAVDRVARARRAVEAVFSGYDEAPNAA